jgi:hypothetical protein
MRWAAPFAVVVLAVVVNAISWAGHDVRPWLGVDFLLFREFGQRWLDTGSMYLPSQFDGPYSVWWTYEVATTPSMYPPAAGPLFGLLALIPTPLAAALWWCFPVAVVAFALNRWRPAPWAWAVMAALFVLPAYGIMVIVGSSTMWAVALVALGLMYRWPAALILLKPTLAPFALVGIRDPRWWIVAVVIVVTTWSGGYLDVVRNGTDSGGLAYSLAAYPLMLLPVVAWLGRSELFQNVGVDGTIRFGQVAPFGTK